MQQAFEQPVMDRRSQRVRKVGMNGKAVEPDIQRQFEMLVGPHFEALHRAAFRLTRGRHDAEDLVQEVCLRAYREIEKLHGLDSVRSWLLRVQYRLFVDGVRRRRRSPFDPNRGHGETSEGLASEEPGPAELTQAESTRKRLQVAWEALTADQRALLAMHAEGYQLAELEAILGKSRNVLSARLHRARNRLAKLMAEDEPTRLRPICTENSK